MYRVMVADDEPLMRKAMVSLTNWQELNCEVVYAAKNGQQVLEHLEDIKPDILVTDIKMPGKDGIEIAKYIFEQKLPIKVILLTAYADFSYAQSAVKYNVVDYVTKTGAFDGLILAVNKAKDLLEKERESTSGENRETAVEYLLKSIFDGSIYEEAEIASRLAGFQLEPKQYLVLLLHFRLNDEMDIGRKARAYKSLLNFFSMVFGNQMIMGVPVQRDMYAIVIQDMQEDYHSKVREQAGQISDMMDNFMGLYVTIGVSASQNDAVNLKNAYEQAESSLGNHFFGEGSKINFYGHDTVHQERYNPEIDKQTDKLSYRISQGDVKESVDLFHEILQEQKNEGYTANAIRNSGIIIQQHCRKILDQYGNDIYHATGFTGSITEKILRCFYVDEYDKLMTDIISKSAKAIVIAASRKNTMVSECERFINENFQNRITVTDAANHVGTSISYLSRIFKETTGEKIITTLNKKRIEKAKEYLKNSDMKIYEIADALGFENTTYFSCFFKKYTGVSPKEYK